MRLLLLLLLSIKDCLITDYTWIYLCLTIFDSCKWTEAANY